MAFALSLFSLQLDRVRRITKFRFQNRYSEEFELAVRRTRREEWQVRARVWHKQPAVRTMVGSKVSPSRQQLEHSWHNLCQTDEALTDLITWIFFITLKV